jgi:hypothetical protein
LTTMYITVGVYMLTARYDEPLIIRR